MIAIRRAMAVLIPCLLLVPASAMAGSVGGFIEFGHSYAASIGEPLALPASFFDLVDRGESSIGLTYDSNLHRVEDRLNWRFDVGYHYVRWDDYITQVFAGPAHGLMLNGALGYGFIRTPELRAWLGPALRMNFDSYGDIDLFDYQLGLGPQLGVNAFDLASVSLAYNYKWGWAVDRSGFGRPTRSHRDHYVGLSATIFFYYFGEPAEPAPLPSSGGHHPMPEQVPD
jgi:hypothetical protein